MLGRCRLRRGVSLEVIVEEDDNAEVSFDPTPLMEEDDDDDDDDDSENGTGGSTPNSPREDGGRGGEGGKGEGRSSIEERRRKRERRRTIGGLSRFRSVSCEALTLLDTSDMDSCCSEWDDDDDLATSSSSNYVTLNRPISRRRIIENSQSHCDSEDSGIEYHSNEDDHVLEDHSSNEDHIDEEEDAKEEDEEEVDTDVTPSTAEVTEEEDNQQEEEEEEEDEGDESATITKESDEEDVEEIQAESQEVIEVDDNPSSARDGKELFEERDKQSPKQERRNGAVQTGKFAYSPNEALENDKIVIVETTPSAPIKKPQQSGLEAAEEEMRLKREAYTIRNKEVRLAELPRPHTVKSVKQLFENLNTPVQHFHAWRDLGRFRDIKSNPSSKILRFDRHDGNDAPISRQSLMSFTLPRLPSQGGHHQNKPTKTTNDSTTKIKATSEVVEKPQRVNKKVPQNYQETPMSRILTQSVALKGKQKGECHRARSGSKPQEPLPQVKTQSGEKVVLRKPIVKGFNVKRALMENPRNFLPHNHNHQQQQQQPQNHNSQNNIRQRLGHLTKSHHHSETTDRSDTESLASDISDDSGVSNDSLASTTSSTPSSYRALDAYASDPSFKWIDPAVMAKIRSVGTTVIFFGPRQRPRQEGTLTRGKKSISSGLQVTRGQTMSRTSQPTSQSKKAPASRQQVPNNTPIPAPRIVGVVRKQSTSTISTSSATSATTSPSPSVHHTPAPTPTPTDTQSDDSRASSPASRSEDETSSPGKAGRWRNESDTIVYNFTRPQPPAVYF